MDVCVCGIKKLNHKKCDGDDVGDNRPANKNGALK